ncbi:MAG: ParM/StbA family protein [Anaerolineales bacterium]|nr:ParM/StbA family protein [Anaerolineales bacterium]
MSVLVLDAGNSIIKAKITNTENGETVFPHAMQPLTESEYEKIQIRLTSSSISKDYVRINGKPYVVGESAERHGVLVQRSGSARYTRDYYGILAAAALARLYERGREIAVFGSHPPGDVKFREDLMKAVIGDWYIETGQHKTYFTVIYANTFDEPVGGLMNLLLTEDGQHYQYGNVGAGRSLVIDIGGFTTDWLAVNPGGEVDYSLAQSIPIGIQKVVTDFEESFRANNLEIVKDTPVLPPDKVRQAIVNGVFEGGGRKYPCKEEVEEATSLFLNRFADTYQRIAGGALSWDAIILTGGGSALLYHKLVPILRHDNLILADSIDSLHLANVRGGLKLWRLYDALKVL